MTPDVNSRRGAGKELAIPSQWMKKREGTGTELTDGETEMTGSAVTIEDAPNRKTHPNATSNRVGSGRMLAAEAAEELRS